jgi:Flp pilus assembly pilin Flp
MRNLLKRFWYEESGMGTVEIVIIIAVLVGVALLFQDQITGFVETAANKIFDDDIIDKALGE